MWKGALFHFDAICKLLCNPGCHLPALVLQVAAGSYSSAGWLVLRRLCSQDLKVIRPARRLKPSHWQQRDWSNFFLGIRESRETSME